MFILPELYLLDHFIILFVISRLFQWSNLNTCLDIVDIKPANMEELTEVITAAEFHPVECSTFAYSSSKGTVRLCDMRESALCDRHSKCKLLSLWFLTIQMYTASLFTLDSVIDSGNLPP